MPEGYLRKIRVPISQAVTFMRLHTESLWEPAEEDEEEAMLRELKDREAPDTDHSLCQLIS